MIHKLTKLTTRTFAFVLALCATTSAWATYENGTALSWKSRDSITTKTNLDGGGYSFKIKLPVSDDLPKFSRVKITQIKLGARSGYDVSNCGAYIRINGVNSDSISAFDGTMPVDSSESVSLNVCNYEFTSDLILMAGIEYTMQPYNSSGTAINAATAAIKPLPSPQVIYFGSDTSWCCAYEVYGEVISTVVPTYKASPSGTNVSLNSLSWTLDDEAADLPSDLSTCGLEVTLNDGATLAIDKDISDIFTFALKGENATLDLADSSYMSATTAWDFSGFTGNLTFNVDDDIDATMSACLKPWMNSDLIGLTVKVSGDDSVAASWSGNTTFTTHTTFDGGTANLTVIQDSNGIDLCNNSSNVNPLWRVKDNTILNLTGKDLGGWSAAQKAQYCVMAVDGGGRLNLKDNGSNTFYYQGRFLLAPDATLDVQTTNNRLRLNGGITSGYEQIYVPDQITDMTATPAVVSGTGAVNANNNGFGIYVGENAQLDWSASIVRNDSAKIVKNGAGTLKIIGQDIGFPIAGNGGTIELSANKTYNKIKVAQDFSGKLKLVAPTTSDWWWGFTDLSGAQHLPGRPELELDMSTQNLFLTDMYNNGANPLTVKNLSGSATVTSSWGGSSAGNKIIDSLQTDNTTFSGLFTGDANDATSLTVRGADNASTIYGLTLSGVSDTRGPLTIENKAKVVFSSTGKWSGGTVTVKNGGVLESQNTGSIAANLSVEEGATLKFASGVQLSATDYDWSAISNDESINVDLSAITPSATPVILIADGVDVSSDKFRVAASQCPVTLSVDNGALKASFFNFWRDGTWGVEVVPGDDATLYISQNSELTVSEALILGAVTVVKEGAEDMVLTISGDGALTTGGWTIPEGVTVNTPPTMRISGMVSGAGVLNVPANNTLEMDDSVCSVKITANTGSTINFTDCEINGGLSAPQNGSVTINTYGTVSFGSSANNDFQYSTTLNVERGTTTYNSKDDTKLWCTINVKSGATLVNAREDGFNWGADTRWPIHAHIWGTLTMNEKWTIGAGNYIHLYNGALINGTASNALHFNTGCGNIVAEKGDSIITAPFVKDEGTIAVETKAGATLSTVYTPEIATRTGEGKLLKRIVDATRWGGDSAPANYDGIELYSSGSHASNDNETFLNSSFAGYLKITTKDGDYRSFGWVSAGSFNNPVFSSRPTLELAGDVRIYQATSDKPFTVKNLSGTGDIYNFNDTDNTTFKYIDTLQTKDTTYSGIVKNISSCSNCDPSLTVRGADDATDIYSLTLSGVSDTTAPLTIENKAKVVFASTGKWSGGTVTVKNGGVLESQNSDEIAATLVVEKGATLKFATGDQSIQATAYDWSDVDEELEENERIKVDISEATPSNTPISIIPSGVTVDVSKFVISPALNPYTTPYSAALSVDNGALKVTYSGNFCQDGSWLVGPTANGDAKVWLTQNSTLTTTTDLSLGSVAFSNMAGADVTLTVDGTGELKFGGLNLPSKITIDVAGKLTITGSVSGAGTINVLDGGELTMDDATCSTKITVQDGGKLYTKGTTTLSSSANVFYYGSAFEVVDGTTTLTTASAGLKGNITIDGNATLTVGATGGINSGATALEPTELHVYGSLNMSSYLWVFGANNALYFYTGCSFAGEGPDAFGPLEINYSPIYVRPNGETTGTVTLPLKTVFRHDTSVDVAANMTFTIAGYLQIGYAGDWVGFAKTGTGDFTLTPSGYNTGINFATTTVSAGRMIMTSMPMFPSVVIEDGATFTLKDTEWTSGNVFSGTGILELYSATVSKTHTITGSTFGGTLKLSNVPVPGSNPPTWQNNINPSGSAMFDSSVRPEFVCDSTATHLGSGYYKSDSTKIEVRNLSGAGSLRAQWTSSSDCHYTIETKQTKATAFTGTIAAEDGDSKTGGGKYTRYINLSVIGDDSETPNSLTITQRQNTSSSDSSQALSTLTVSDNAKVIFGENGGWGYGHVIVGDDGYLECTNNAAVKKLTLNDGATLVFPTSSSCLSEITSITFSSGTVTVSYPSGVTPTSGTKLINWSSAPAGSFVFDNGSTVKQFGGAYGDYYMLETDATGLYIRKAVAVDSLVSSTFYTSVAGALEENNTVYLIAAPDESVTLPVGKTISNQMGVSTSNLTVSPTTAEYAVQYVVNGSYTVASTAVTYYWAGAAGGDWGTRSNWKVAAADGPDATRDMETTDSVAFTDGAIVALGATRRVAGIAIDGTVYVSAVDAATKSLETTGNITGTGALTLVDVTLANVATATLTVAPAVNFTSDSELAATGGYGFTFNGAVSISDTDTIKVWNVNHSVAGTTTLNGNFTKAGGYGLILGAVTVAANTTPTISNGSITINGAVTVSAGATFTIPASGLTVGDSASFVLGGKSSVLVDNGSGASGKVSTSMTDGAKVISTTSAGVTTYKVVYGTIFSVY